VALNEKDRCQAGEAGRGSFDPPGDAQRDPIKMLRLKIFNFEKLFGFKICSISNFIFKFKKNPNSNLFKLYFVQI
jgi:hypothetical protein